MYLRYRGQSIILTSFGMTGIEMDKDSQMLVFFPISVAPCGEVLMIANSPPQQFLVNQCLQCCVTNSAGLAENAKHQGFSI